MLVHFWGCDPVDMQPTTYFPGHSTCLPGRFLPQVGEIVLAKGIRQIHLLCYC